jgi:hypothetical protein
MTVDTRSMSVEEGMSDDAETREAKGGRNAVRPAQCHASRSRLTASSPGGSAFTAQPAATTQRKPS